MGLAAMRCPHCRRVIPEDEWCCDEAMSEAMTAAAARWWEDE